MSGEPRNLVVVEKEDTDVFTVTHPSGADVLILDWDSIKNMNLGELQLLKEDIGMLVNQDIDLMDDLLNRVTELMRIQVGPHCYSCLESAGVVTPASFLAPQLRVDRNATFHPEPSFDWILVCTDHHDNWWGIPTSESDSPDYPYEGEPPHSYQLRP